MVGISQRLLSEAFVVDDAVTTAPAFAHVGSLETVHEMHWGTGVQAGAVAIESAHKSTSENWETRHIVTFDGSVTSAPKMESVRIHGAYRAFRHRVVDPIEGGTVTTKLVGGMD